MLIHEDYREIRIGEESPEMWAVEESPEMQID